MEKGKYYEPSETGMMHELGNVQNAAHGMRALTPRQDELPDPTQKAVKITIADDDAAAAIISNSPDTRTQAGTKTVSSKSSRFHIYSEPGKQRVKLEGEIKAINAYDGFLLGVHDKIEEFPRHSEFGLEQVLDVEKRMAEVHETLELYKFTLKRVREEAFKALQCQGNLGPERALNLLKDNIAKLIAAGQAKDQQAVTDPEHNK
jgi:hypothetical protein